MAPHAAKAEYIGETPDGRMFDDNGRELSPEEVQYERDLDAAYAAFDRGDRQPLVKLGLLTE